MSPDGSATRSIDFSAGDGAELVGEIVIPARPHAAAIVCHPHPQYGGNRHNNVVEALFRALPDAGIAALRFDFRDEFGGGVAEQLDAVAALDELSETIREVPLIATGYSFGAMVVLGLDDPRVVARVLVAPPLGAIEIEPGRPCPTLVLTAEHDQFAPPDVARPIVAEWDATDFDTIPSADHFLVGGTGSVTQKAVSWLDENLS